LGGSKEVLSVFAKDRERDIAWMRTIKIKRGRGREVAVLFVPSAVAAVVCGLHLLSSTSFSVALFCRPQKKRV